MDQAIDELEYALVRSPFDQDLRLTYARRLFELDRFEDALAQYELLSDQAGDAPLSARSGPMSVSTGTTRGSTGSLRRSPRPGGLRTHRGTRVHAGDASGRGRNCRRSRAAWPRSSSSSVPTTTEFGSDVAGMGDLKRLLRIQIVEPFLRPGSLLAVQEGCRRRNPALRSSRLRQDNDGQGGGRRVRREFRLGRNQRCTLPLVRRQ